MRVLHLVKTTTGGNWAQREMRELRALGCDVHVALPDDGGLAGQYREAGVTVHTVDCNLPVRRPWLLPRRAMAFRHLVDKVSPDCLHSHFVTTTLFARVARDGRKTPPMLFQVPGPLHLEHGLPRRLELATAGASDSWIATCNRTRDIYIASGVSPKRVHVSYYGIDLPDRYPERTGALRAQLDVPDSRKIVGMVAYIYPPKRALGQGRGIKGHEDLIDALAACLEKGLDVQGVFIGGAWGAAQRYEGRIRAYASQRLGSRASFLGNRSDVAALYPEFDVAVHPSHSENVGGAGESLLYAVPTIATDVGGLPDFVIPGVSGWLVPPKNPRCLADAIADALSQPARGHEMALRGRAMVVERLDVRKTAAQVLSIYERLREADVT